ncbi:MAG: TetR/AcrR family transcriptional regulator [Lactobacillus sp.]|jgi:AcrR family transcriptional regulator|nr:TetR/AcrR family transcriptional regulator [Lactobacillus sp.]
MARRKNIRRRRIILRNTFLLIKEHGLDNVSLQMIADKSEISKSLLQSYYPHKSKLINDLMQEFMTVILKQVAKKGASVDNTFAEMKVFIDVLLELALRDIGVARALDSFFNNLTALGKWGKMLDDWLREEGLEQELGNDQQTRIGLSFVVGGCINLYHQRGDLGITPEQISDIMVKTFFSTFLDTDSETVQQDLDLGHDLIKKFSLDELQTAVNQIFTEPIEE